MSENNTNKPIPATKPKFFKRPAVQSVLAMLAIFGALAGFLYFVATSHTVSTDDAFLEAPTATIAPVSAGLLNAVYVKEGDTVAANTPVALVGTETLYTKDTGIVASAPKVLGSFFGPGQAVVTIIANHRMQVVASLEETKGLEDIKAGQAVTFTVDAFPGKDYVGKVDSVSPSSSETGVVFAISDKRPIKHFNIYVAFDTSAYPELKSGMSAKIKVNTR